MANLTKINHFLINQVIQSSNKKFQSNKKINEKSKKSIEDVEDIFGGINKIYDEGKLHYEQLEVKKNDLCNLLDILKIMTCDVDNRNVILDDFISKKLINQPSEQFIESFEKDSKS